MAKGVKYVLHRRQIWTAGSQEDILGRCKSIQDLPISLKKKDAYTDYAVP